MGGQFVDIVLFALVAFFLVVRLWTVLGRKTDDERPPQMPPTAIRRGGDNVVSLPDRPRLVEAQAPRSQNPVESDPVEAGLAQIRSADPAFRIDTFLDGARHAFELIVKSFAVGDTATLRPLVSDDVYDIFAEAIRHRLAVNESVDTRVVKFQDPEPVEARLEGRTAIVTVKFISSQISVTRNAQGQIVEGDPERPFERTDHWTFSRNTRSLDPNWILVATGPHEHE